LFVEKGFSATTMDDVAAAARMSKKTLYRLFSSKIALFRALLELHHPQLENLSAPPAIEGSVEEQLVALISFVASAILSPREIALHRLIIREALIAPDLAEMFADLMVDPDPLGLVECMKKIPSCNNWTDADRLCAAEMLLGMVVGAPHFKLMINDRFRPEQAEVQRRIRIAVRLFLRGLGVACTEETKVG
jgi:TetR/AcrR family transcriptional repressor of mexJK operon